MSFLDLPHEIVEAVITEAVRSVGIHGILSARLVCKTFDASVQHAVFFLPTFNGGMPWLEIPPNWKCKREMGVAMTTRLIISKLKSANTERRELYCVITEALDYLTTVGYTDASLHERCKEALIAKAASSLSYWSMSKRIYDNLRPRAFRGEDEQAPSGLDQRQPGHAPMAHQIELQREHQRLLWERHRLECKDEGSGLEFPERADGNALIAALGTGSAPLVATLLVGRDISLAYNYKSPLFGSLPQVMVRYGSEADIRTVMSKHIPTCSTAAEDDAQADEKSNTVRQTLTAEAANTGRMDLVSLLLEPQYWHGSKVCGNERAIIKALWAGREDIAVLLLSQPGGLEAWPIEKHEYYYRWPGTCFILDLVRVCTERNYVETMRFALERAKELELSPEWLTKARETSCPRDWVNTNGLDTRRRKVGRGGTSITHYDLALFNAARCGSIGMMELILRLSPGIDINEHSHNKHFGLQVHPLVAAARNGHLQMVQYLIGEGVDVSKCGCGTLALRTAAERVFGEGKDDAGLREMVENLLEAGLDPEKVAGIKLEIPLYARWFQEYMANTALDEMLIIVDEEWPSRNSYTFLADAEA